MFLTIFVITGKKDTFYKSNIMQLFCNKDSPVHSQLYENMCLQVEYYQKQLYFASESASSIIRRNYDNTSQITSTKTTQ